MQTKHSFYVTLSISAVQKIRTFGNGEKKPKQTEMYNFLYEITGSYVTASALKSFGPPLSSPIIYDT